MLQRITLYILTILAATAAGCSAGRSDGDSPRRLAVSVEPLRALLAPLAAGRFEVSAVMDRSADPESFEPSVARRIATDDAEALFATGALPFEAALAETLPRRVALVTLIDSIDALYGTHDHCTHPGHRHGAPDPHIWTSARNAAAITRAMAATLMRLDPDGAALYASRRDSLCARLDSLDAAVAARLADVPSRAFVVWHPSLSYAARDYGLQQVALGAEGKDFSAAAIRRAIDEATEAGARVCFVQRGQDTGRTRSVAAETGMRIVEIDFTGADWPAQLNIIADELARP